MSTRSLGRFEGRLFVENGRLCMVVEADETAGTATVSFRKDGVPNLIEMPLSEVSRHISSGAELALDNLNTASTGERVVEKSDGWYFSAREGQKGPFGSAAEAEAELQSYIVSSQSAA